MAIEKVVAIDAKDVTLKLLLRDATTGAPKTGVTITDLDFWYIRTEVDNDVTLSAKVDWSALTSLTDAHTDDKAYEIGHGYYRFDFRNNPFADGASRGTLIIEDAASDTILPVLVDFYLIGSKHVWFVSKEGFDGRGGHSIEEAKLTITGVLNASPATGDSIIIGQGTFDEELDLSSLTDITLTGSGWGTIISKDSPASQVLKMGTGCRLKNLKVITSASDKVGVYSDSVDRLVFDGCFTQSGLRALYLETAVGVTIKDSVIIGVQCAAQISDCDGVRIVDCPLIKAAGYTTSIAYGLRLENSNGVMSGCNIDVSRPEGASTGDSTRGVDILGDVGRGVVSISNCAIRASDAVDSNIYGLAVRTNARVTVVVGVIEVDGTDDGDYAVYQADSSKIVVAGCRYDTTKVSGTVTQMNSGWAAGVNAEVDTALSDINLDHVSAMQDTLDVLLRTILESSVMTVTTVDSLASQTSFTLSAGSPDDDAYNNCMIILKSVSTPARKAIGIVSDYTGSSKTITLVADPGIFTLFVGDEVFIVSAPKDISDIKKLLRADKVIDNTETPWVIDYKAEGTEDVLMSKTMKKADDSNITSENNVLGKLEKET